MASVPDLRFWLCPADRAGRAGMPTVWTTLAPVAAGAGNRLFLLARLELASHPGEGTVVTPQASSAQTLEASAATGPTGEVR